VTAATALVLAGSRGPGDPLALHAGVSHKAMIEVGGEPMLVRVVRALAEAGFGRVAVVIERPELVDELAAQGRFPPSVKIEVLAAAEGPSLSVAQALAWLGTPLLVTTADHALLRPEWVRWFVEHVPEGADVAAGLARSDLVMAAAPEARRTFLRFSDGAFSGCNLFYFATPAALRAVDLWREVEAHRKQPVKLLARLGPLTAARYALGALPLGAALARLGALAGLRCAAVEMPFGEAAIDVDKPEDLALARRLA
jgi:GTP:adenosylcobinamide-phosphate guanylyltransferase